MLQSWMPFSSWTAVCLPPNRPEKCSEKSWYDITTVYRDGLEDCPSPEPSEVCTNECSDCRIGVCCQLVQGTRCTYKCLLINDNCI